MAAPTYPASADLVQGTGTRSFSAVTTAAGDYLVIEVIIETSSSGVPAMTPLTWTQQTNIDTGASHTEIFQFTAPDAAGGSRTIQIVPNTTAAYAAHLTVVRGSGGPGTGKGTAGAAQTVSVVRSGANSAMFMTIGDWAAGAVGSPVWMPGGTTQQSQQGSQGTYLFGRWDDSGATATASHGISSPSYTTPSIAVLEMLGVASGTTINGTATLTGAGTLTSAATQAATAAPTAAGTLTGAATLAPTATLAGASTLAALATQAATATLTGAGTLSASVAGNTQGTATLTAAGALTATGTVRVPGTAALTAAGSLTVVATQTAGTTAAASGSLVAAGVVAGSATLTGSSALTAPATLAASATLTAAGTLTATVASVISGTAVLAATGTLTAAISSAITARPVTGVTARPGISQVARPLAGTVTRP